MSRHNFSAEAQRGFRPKRFWHRAEAAFFRGTLHSCYGGVRALHLPHHLVYSPLPAIWTSTFRQFPPWNQAGSPEARKPRAPSRLVFREKPGFPRPAQSSRKPKNAWVASKWVTDLSIGGVIFVLFWSSPKNGMNRHRDHHMILGESLFWGKDTFEPRRGSGGGGDIQSQASARPPLPQTKAEGLLRPGRQGPTPVHGPPVHSSSLGNLVGPHFTAS